MPHLRLTTTTRSRRCSSITSKLPQHYVGTCRAPIRIAGACNLLYDDSIAPAQYVPCFSRAEYLVTRSFSALVRWFTQRAARQHLIKTTSH
jgi:hypothetical protein